MKNLILILLFAPVLAMAQTNNFNILDRNAPTITGGTVDGATIGATTPSTGAFTTLSSSGAATMSTTAKVGAATLTLTTGAFGLSKMTASASAPGAGGGKIELVCGTNAGTAKLIIYAGTSGTAVTVVDNIGAGVTGC